MTNHRLGWVAGGLPGSLVAKGACIGTVVTVNKERIILFNPVPAFDAAKKAYDSLVKHGQGRALPGLASGTKGSPPTWHGRSRAPGPS